MPTGAGKSLTYQLAAMLRATPTLVLSPLIALMKDQVDKLPPRIGATATFVNSSLGPDDAAARLESVRAGRTRILYAAPERLRQESFVRTLRSIGVGLVVIDEVHCVSMWGHDFRPDYLFIRRALDELDGPAVLGMTATATPANATAIADALGRRLELVRTSVHRPNLRYDVERAENAEERLRALLRRLRELREGVAIVYARSRRSSEEIARTLCGHGIRAEHYHAGLEADERTRVQEAFVAGRTPVVVATTAFGMGIDKANVRLVALVNYPDSLESYVQMVGRAGRDGRPSDTVLLAGDADASALRRFALGGVPTPELLRHVYRAVREAGASSSRRPSPRLWATPTIHASWSACSSRQELSAGGTTPGGRCAWSSCPWTWAPAARSTRSSTGMRASRPRASSGSSRSRKPSGAAICRWPSTSARRWTARAAPATSAHRSRRVPWPSHSRRRSPTSRRGRSSTRSTASRGRSGGAASSRCSAAP